jgi:hypothetical protein
MRAIAIIRAHQAAATRSEPGRKRADDGTPAVAQGRSLVPFAPLSRPDVCGHAARPSAPFLAHLIATAQQAPQTRQRGRAEPASACTHYAAARAAAPAPSHVGWL